MNRFPGRVVFWLAGPVTGGLLGACASSTVVRSEPLDAGQATLPPTGQARIVALNKPGYWTPQLQSFGCLDGQGIDSQKDLIVAPGRHYFTLLVNFGDHLGSELLWLDAQPDRVYEVRYRARINRSLSYNDGSEFLSYLADRATNRAVGGITGGQPPVAHDSPQCSYKRIKSSFSDPDYSAQRPGRPPAVSSPRARGNAVLVGLQPSCTAFLMGIDEALVFTAVDGRSTTGGLAGVLTNNACTYASQVEVAPGRHQLAVNHYVYGLPQPETVKIEVDAQPGAIYDVKRVIRGYGISYQIVRILDCDTVLAYRRHFGHR